ncbi:MAG: carbamoyl phosphate synthase small subunit [Thermoplasmatales archaeon]|nr:carbamoyl phosphate synthase small subunit [Candidatus Thermoplasmatota archaeon]MCL6003541.1 carbamoyl phosphate synthase small subunit [Candidatus Thermoplasmatota archaeon]MDA8054106.1 carbamoyl phosphate synthase small subunit [Thermoplasmatales archaeon]
MKLGRLYVDGLGVFEGESIGRDIISQGELVFTTSPSGYIKSITDPSYSGQILVFSFPFIGSYGIGEKGESGRPRVRGVVVNHVPELLKSDFSEYLEKWGIPGIITKDTRKIVDYIRVNGNKLGSFGIDKFVDPYKSNLIDETLESESPGDGNLLLVDLGLKRNILKFLGDYSVTVVPYNKLVPKWIDMVDGVIVSNGPGDPTHVDLVQFVKRLKTIIETKPTLGICLGHQLISLSLGMRTEKMKFGHRSINHPVEDLSTGRIGITTHNHGFTVVFDGSRGAEERFRSMNDGTNEGLEGKNFLTAQFHPEGGPGPVDELSIFEEFRRMVSGS